MKQWVLGNQPSLGSSRNSELFTLKFLLKLFFKSLKIILIINFFYILNIFFFSSHKEGGSNNVGGRPPTVTVCCWLGRHLSNLHGDINILVWGLLLSEQILHCHRYPQAKVCMNGFIIKMWLPFQNRKSISYDNFVKMKPQILIKSFISVQQSINSNQIL